MINTLEDTELKEQILEFNNILKGGDKKAAALLQEAIEYITFAQNIGWAMTLKDALKAVFIEKQLKKELEENWSKVVKQIQEEAPAFREEERRMLKKLNLTKGRPRKGEARKRIKKHKV